MADNDREEWLRARAHELWERDGGTHGRHDEHWRQAEQEYEDRLREGGSTRSSDDTHDDPTEMAPAAPALAGGKGLVPPNR